MRERQDYVGPPEWMMELREIPGWGFEAYMCGGGKDGTVSGDTIPEVMANVTEWVKGAA